MIIWPKWSKISEKLSTCLEIFPHLSQLAQTVTAGWSSRSQLKDFATNCNSKLPQEMWIWKAWQEGRPNLNATAKGHQISGIALNSSISQALAITILHWFALIRWHAVYTINRVIVCFCFLKHAVRLGMITSVNFLKLTSFDIVWLILIDIKSATAYTITCPPKIICLTGS